MNIINKVIVISFIGYSGLAMAADEFVLTIKDHQFSPTELVVPANTKIKLIIKNLDPTPEEFESQELNKEKIIPGAGESVIFIGPQKAGEYPFFGEFNPETAKGVMIVK